METKQKYYSPVLGHTAMYIETLQTFQDWKLPQFLYENFILKEEIPL